VSILQNYNGVSNWGVGNPGTKIIHFSPSLVVSTLLRSANTNGSVVFDEATQFSLVVRVKFGRNENTYNVGLAFKSKSIGKVFGVGVFKAVVVMGREDESARILAEVFLVLGISDDVEFGLVVCVHFKINSVSGFVFVLRCLGKKEINFSDFSPQFAVAPSPS
jgi:hypothetical protein